MKHTINRTPTKTHSTCRFMLSIFGISRAITAAAIKLLLLQLFILTTCAANTEGRYLLITSGNAAIDPFIVNIKKGNENQLTIEKENGNPATSIRIENDNITFILNCYSDESPKEGVYLPRVNVFSFGGHRIERIPKAIQGVFSRITIYQKNNSLPQVSTGEFLLYPIECKGLESKP